MSLHEPSHVAAGIPLKAHAEALRRRVEAVARLHGGAAYFPEELGIFRAYADEAGLWLGETPAALRRAPDDEGNEHQVWFEEATRSYLKATWPDFFGLLVIHRAAEEPKASPIGYLERWDLHNELFGDTVSFLGVVQTEAGMRLVIRQPAIAGTPATEEQIHAFFTDSGWRPFEADGSRAYFDPERSLVISDTHRANLILMDDGLLAPIDLRVQPVSGALRDAVVQLCHSF